MQKDRQKSIHKKHSKTLKENFKKLRLVSGNKHNQSLVMVFFLSILVRYGLSTAQGFLLVSPHYSGTLSLRVHVPAMPKNRKTSIAKEVTEEPQTLYIAQFCRSHFS